MRTTLLAAGALLALAWPAQAQQRIPGTNVPAVSCGPSNTSQACQELRRALGAVPGLIAPQAAPGAQQESRGDMNDVRAQRFIPPAIRATLSSPRIDPVVRATLLSIAGKTNPDWTLADLQGFSAIVPTLVEAVPNAALRELYEFVGLDPDDLFNPQVGGNWQVGTSASTLRGATRHAGACATAQRVARRDPAEVRVDELIGCNTR